MPLPVAPTETGQFHGPWLPDHGTPPEHHRHMRFCKCGSVETGWPHQWHEDLCPRVATYEEHCKLYGITWRRYANVTNHLLED